jgi:Ribonuclease G/E
VERQIKGQGGVFLRSPDGPLFLRQSKGLAPGDALTVQVTGYADPGKAIPVTSRLLFKSRYAIVTPGAPGKNISKRIRDKDLRDTLQQIAMATMPDGDMGLILRSSCAEADLSEIEDDIAIMVEAAQQVCAVDSEKMECLHQGDTPHLLAWRERTEAALIAKESGSFEDHGVLDMLDGLTDPRHSLDQGAFMFVEPTRALTAIDVNTGSDTSPAATLKANISAAKALPSALRLRGLGGQVTIDFAPLSKKHRRDVEAALRTAFRSDPVDTTLVGWTPLGHFELQRKRERVPVFEVLT